MISLKLAAMAVLGGIVILAAACGGSKLPDTATSATKSAATPGRSGTAAAGTTQVRSGLGDLSSYKCTLKIVGQGGPLSELEALYSSSTNSSGGQTVSFDASVTYVRPDKAQLTLKLGSETFGQTTIGRQQWSTLGSLTVGPNAVGALSPAELSLCASFWDDGFASGASAFQCSGNRESVNGLQTRKCSIDRGTFDQVRQFLGGVLSDSESGIKDLSRFEMELWVSEGSNSIAGGLPVRLRADMAGKDASSRDFSMKIEMDVTNINDSSLKVTAPR